MAKPEDRGRNPTARMSNHDRHRTLRANGYLFSVLPASCRQNGTMRHATVCRQDAGSTFGVTFRPPLNTYANGVLECWSVGVLEFPALRYSITPFLRYT